MKKPLTPPVKNGGFIASVDYTPLVYPGGKTTIDATNPEEISTDEEIAENKDK